MRSGGRAHGTGIAALVYAEAEGGSEERWIELCSQTGPPLRNLTAPAARSAMMKARLARRGPAGQLSVAPNKGARHAPEDVLCSIAVSRGNALASAVQA